VTVEFADREEIIAYLLEHFERPKNRGPLEGAGVVHESGGNPGCGDVVTIHLDPAGEAVAAATFEGQGCTISMAAADILIDLVRGRPLDDVLAMTAESLVEELGREVVIARLKCATLALNALKAAVERRARNERRRALGLPLEEAPAAPPDMTGVEGGPDPFGKR
jgi:nitrogen fixation NifU-like protein